MNNYCNIGKLVATHGLQGQLILKHNLGKKTALKGLEAMFIEVKKDELLPYFITTATAKNNDEVLIAVEGVVTKEQAMKLTQKQVWLLQADFEKFTHQSSSLSMLGFNLISEEEDLGTILEIIEQPHQVLCRIDLNGNEALIPLHADTLQKVDRKNKKVFVTLPNGLLDIYR
jgi:16S rRNA processing protein RimM